MARVDDWLRAVGETLNAGASGPNVPGRVHNASDGIQTAEVLTRVSKQFLADPADAGLEWTVQVIPAGYYDTVSIAWTFNATPDQLLQPQKSIVVYQGKLRSSEGIVGGTGPNTSLLEWSRTYPLLAHKPPGTAPGLPVEIGGSLRLETVLTNAPFFVALISGNDQTIIKEDAAGLAGVAVCVTLETLRY